MTVITDANKDKSVVIVDVEVYDKEAERQLNNNKNYRKINYDLATANNATINKVILSFQKENLLSNNISEGIKTENPETLHFYFKPKIHKKSNLGRPLLSSINCYTFLNTLITTFTQLVKKSYCKCKIQPIFLGRLNKLNLFLTVAAGLEKQNFTN